MNVAISQHNIIFSKNTKILLQKEGGENIFKPTIGNEGIHQNYDNGFE